MKRLILLFPLLLSAQVTKINLATQARNVDFSLFPYTKPFKFSAALPATCSEGETLFLYTAPAGSNFYGCTATNTWTLESGAGSGLPTVTTGQLLSNLTGGTTTPTGNSLTATFDFNLCSAQGDIIYRNGSVWTCLTPGTSGYVLQTGGPSANPSWVVNGMGTPITIYLNGSSVASEPKLNFINGTYITQACVDNAGATRVDCTPDINTTTVPTQVSLQSGAAISAVSTSTNASSLSGTVNTNGQIVTWVGGSTFNYNQSGGTITINGVMYTVSPSGSVSATTIDLTTSAGVQTNVSWSQTVSGGTFTASTTPNLTAYTQNMVINWLPDAYCNGGDTLNINSLGAIPIKKNIQAYQHNVGITAVTLNDCIPNEPNQLIGYGNPVTAFIIQPYAVQLSELPNNGNIQIYGTNCTIGSPCTPNPYTIFITTSCPQNDAFSTLPSIFYINNSGGNCQFNLLAGTTGKFQRCFRNATGNSGIITIAVATSNSIDVNGTNGTTSSGTLVSGGALGDSVCVVDDGSNHWYAFVQNGAWANN